MAVWGPDKSEFMKEDTFWDYVEEVYRSEEGEDRIQVSEIPEVFNKKQNNIILDRLEEAGDEEIIEFNDWMNAFIEALYIPRVAEVFAITHPTYLRNMRDGFKNFPFQEFISFRAWIVSLGREALETFLYFESETELLNYNLNPANARRPGFENLCIYFIDIERIKGPLEYVTDRPPEELLSGIQLWNLKAKYPQLWKKYYVGTK